VNTLEDLTLRLYRRVTRAFPEEFQQAYGPGMLDAAEDTVRLGGPRAGLLSRLALLVRLLIDIAMRLIAEHWHDAMRDLRYASRMLLRAKGFTLAAVLCLAIGIGLTTAIYSQIRSTVLRAVPGVSETAGLVRLHRPTAYPYFEQLRDHGGQFSAVAAYMGPVPIVISQDGAQSQRIWAHLATPDYFEVLGTKAAFGRVFGAEERLPGSAQVIVISDRLWRTRFGSDPFLVGRALRVNGQAMTVIGVAPRDFLGAAPTTAAADAWIATTAPAHVAPELGRLRDSRAAAFDVIGRLKPGLSVGQAEDALDAIIRRAEQMHNDPARDSLERRVRLLPGGRMFAVRDEDLPRAIGFPLVLASLVLVMACGNVANMLLARSAARRREMAVRISLGAGRGRIVRQLLTESVLLALLGATAGIAFARWMLSGLESMRPLIPEYGYFDVRFDWQALAFAVLVAAGSGILFGLLPALRASREDIYAGLKPHAAASGHPRRLISLRNVLVFQQVTASIVLLLLTGFVVVGWQRAATVDVGFDTAHLYRVSVDPVRDGYTSERASMFFEQLSDRLRRLQGVRAASLSQTLPLAMSNSEALLSAKVDFAGGTKALGATRADRVGAGFFETVGIPLLRGRTFDRRDESDDSRVLIVNETMARQVWPGDEPVGKTVDFDGAHWQVIGVVGDIRPALPLAPTLPAVYRPITPAGFATPSTHGVTVLLRGVPGFEAAERIRAEVEALDPRVTVFQVTRMEDDVMQALYLARVATFIYGGMGVFGLILASVGLAGVTAQAVARRTHEIGIRMALGARRADVLWLVLRESSAIVAAGTIVGLAAALGLTWALASFVEALAETTQTSISDPLLLVGGPALLAALAMIACYLPARRSTRINPVTALRAE
jgi:macrolide transport system ATP-binding/permease protein